jgi:hypothetical protein
MKQHGVSRLAMVRIFNLKLSLYSPKIHFFHVLHP